MATSRRRTFSGAMGACLLGVTVVIGWVPATTSQAATADPVLVAADACPVSWPALGQGPAGDAYDAYDGQVSVLVGGDLRVTGRAAGAEGVVVVRGGAAFARDEPGTYRVGTTATGSQVPPHPGSDVLVVGGALTADPGTPLAVAPGLDGDTAVGGAVTDGTVLDQGAGTLDRDVADVLAPYAALVSDLGAKSGAYAGRPATGTADVTDTAVTLTGDGTSDPQVFTVDGAALAGVDGTGRSLQVLGVPDGAGVVVNLTGPAVRLDVDTLLGPGGGPVDPATDGYFADLATHLLWNVPSAATVDVGGAGQLPGSLLVGSSPSTTTLAGPGTNGRVWVAGDLVHAGAGELHAYPYVRDPDLTCGPEVKHLGTLTLDVVVKDPSGLVDPDRFFGGTVVCVLDGEDVTPGDGTWQLRAQAKDRVLSDRVPVGATCVVDEQLKVGPAPGWDWMTPDIAPERVKVAKREPRGFTVTNRVQPVKVPPVPEVDEPTPTPDPTPLPPTSDLDPTPTGPGEPVGPTDPTPEPPYVDPEPPLGPTADPEVTVPSVVPVPDVTVDEEGDAQDEPVVAAPGPAPRAGAPGPLTTTAPYSLRGTFVWAPLLLSVLALRLRFPWRYGRRRRRSARS